MSLSDQKDYENKTYHLATMARSVEHFAITLSKEKGVPMETVMDSINHKKAKLD